MKGGLHRDDRRFGPSAKRSGLQMMEVAPPLSPRVFHDRIYASEIVRFGALPAMGELVAVARRIAEAVLAPHHPTKAHRYLSKDLQIERYGEFQSRFSRSELAKELWASIIEQVGLSRDALAGDRLYARVQTHDADAPSRDLVTAPLGFHRDTWGSNLYAQVNWWAPVYPVTAERTMELFPALWDQPLRNSSPDFDLPAVIARNRTTGAPHADVDSVIPHLIDQVDPRLGQPVVIEPGELLAFSGAHAHRSVPNVTGVTRLSIETRTLWIPDVLAGRGATNLDGAARWCAPGWFRRLSDRARVSDLLGCEPICHYEPPSAAVSGARSGL